MLERLFRQVLGNDFPSCPKKLFIDFILSGWRSVTIGIIEGDRRRTGRK
jgi:hypothetical protein